MPRSRALLALAMLAGASLSGCSPFRVSLRHEVPRPTSQFTWEDARPAGEGDSGYESLLITRCVYGIYRIGDDKFTPDRVAALRSDLEAALGTELGGGKVVLKNFTVHFNQAASLRGSVATGYKAPIPLLIHDLMNDTSVHGCSADDLEGGFAGDEVTTDWSPLIVVINLEVNGLKVHARWVESAPVQFNTKTSEDDPAWIEFVTRALQNATGLAVEGVKAALAAG